MPVAPRGDGVGALVVRVKEQDVGPRGPAGRSGVAKTRGGQQERENEHERAHTDQFPDERRGTS